jgi:hypothetical protein
MKKGIRYFLLLLFLAFAGYLAWSSMGRTAPAPDANLHLDTTYTLYADSGKGDIVGISPFMTPSDYASVGNFTAKLDGYMARAMKIGWFNARTVVIFPEYIGTWLVVAGEKTSVYEAPSAQRALATYISSNFFNYLRGWFTAPDSATDKVKHAIFASKGQTMATQYVEVFSGLARKYHVSIVAGSILLPNPEYHKGHIDTWKGSLRNISGVFDTSWKLQPFLVVKSFPTADEQPFIEGGESAAIPGFNLPAGRTSVLVCADSWFPSAYDNLKHDGARIVAVPSYTQVDDEMSTPWTGYSGFPTPKDVDTSDIKKLTLGQAWVKYTLGGRIKGEGRFGMVVPLRGHMWDMGSDGSIISIAGDSVFSPSPGKGASMACLWLH